MLWKVAEADVRSTALGRPIGKLSGGVFVAFEQLSRMEVLGVELG